MRAYFFGNMYLSSIQQGIQAAHVVHEMFLCHPDHEMLWDWAANHKTMVLLNGGYAENLLNITEAFVHPQNTYPFAKFHEEQASLNGSITSVGIVLPPKIYEGAKHIRSGDAYPQTIEQLREAGRIRVCGDSPDGEDDVQYTYNRFDVTMIELLTMHKLAQ